MSGFWRPVIPSANTVLCPQIFQVFSSECSQCSPETAQYFFCSVLFCSVLFRSVLFSFSTFSFSTFTFSTFLRTIPFLKKFNQVLCLVHLKGMTPAVLRDLFSDPYYFIEFFHVQVLLDYICQFFIGITFGHGVFRDILKSFFLVEVLHKGVSYIFIIK